MAVRGLSEQPTVLEVLHSSTLLKALGREDIDRLSPVCHMAQIDRGQVIWMRGDQTPFFGIVGTGFVKMVKSSGDGSELTAEIMGPGQVFGLLGAIEGIGCPLSAQAVTPAWYLKVPKKDFLAVYGDTPALKDHVVIRTASRLRQAYEMMARMANGTVGQRLAAVLVILAESYGERTEGGIEITIPLTRQDLADIAGTTVETTIRTISKWQRDGWVEFAHRRLLIRNEAPIYRQIGTG